MSDDTRWEQVAGSPVWTRSYRIPGLMCRSFAVKLEDGRFLVGSPGPDMAGSFEEELGGEVGFLLAPNSFHHMGLKGWRETFPDAAPVAAPGAHKRLKKKGHAELAGLEAARALLPGGVELVEVPNNRVGEAWLTAEVEGGGRVWVVCDAFFNNARMPRKLSRKVLVKALRSGPGLSISRLFSWGALTGRGAYRSWLMERLQRDQPTALVPNHGEILIDPELTPKVAEVIKAHL